MKWMSKSLAYLLALFVCQTALADLRLVDDLGNPDEIELIGNDTFDGRWIRRALARDLVIMAAGHPRASLPDYLTTLQRRIQEGYWNVGFAQAKVAVKLDKDRSVIVAQIVEGPRWRCGKIEITGASTIPVQRLAERLSTSTIENQFAHNSTIRYAVWDVGDPASFSPAYWKQKEEQIKSEFQALGYFDATFSASTRTENDGTATLVLVIQDEGPRAILGDIEVVGAEKNAPEDVIRFLDLPPGMPLDSEQKAKIERRLHDTGRFIKAEVQIISPPFGDDPSRLRIRLEESSLAPPLTETLTAEDQIMLRMAHWWEQFDSLDDDFDAQVRWQLSGDGGPGTVMTEIRLTLSNRSQGGLYSIRLKELPDRELCHFIFHITPRDSRILSPRNGLLFQASQLTDFVAFNVNWQSTPPDVQGRHSRFNFGFQFGKSDVVSKTGAATMSHPRLPFSLKFSIDPTAALAEVRKRREDVQLKEGILKITYSAGSVEVDAKTGRVIALHADDGERGGASLNCGPGHYQKHLAEFEQQASKARVIEARHTPVTNILHFLASSVAEPNVGQQSPPADKLMALLTRLFKRGVFHSFDDMLLDYFDRPNDNFSIPPNVNSGKQNPLVGQFGLAATLTRMVVPHSSWTMSIGRDLVFALSTNSMDGIQLQLADPRTGPVANLTSSFVFGLMSPQLKRAFAQKGLSRLRLDSFQSDYAPFLDDTSPLGRTLLAAAATLQEIDDTELEDFVNQLPIADADLDALTRVLCLFPSHRSEEPSQVLRFVLDEAWQPLIEPRLRDLLNLLAN